MSLTSQFENLKLDDYNGKVKIENNFFLFNDQLTENEQKLLQNYLKNIEKYTSLIKNKNIIDTGSSFGLFSIYLSQYCRTLYSFEPDRLLFNQLCGNVYINNIENILPFNYGLSDVEGKTTLTRYITEQKETGISEEPIFLQTLDSFQIKNIGLIKLYMNEANIIHGAIKTLYNNNFPMIIINNNECNKNVNSESKNVNSENVNSENIKHDKGVNIDINTSNLYQTLVNLGYTYENDNEFVVFKHSQ